MYQLHCVGQSGNSYKVALLLQVLGQPWKPIHLKFSDFAAGVSRSDAWRQDVNAMGEIPVLDVDGRKMTQSAAIMLWLAEKHGAYRGDDEDQRQEVLRWMFFDNHKFTSYFATLRFLKSFGGSAPDPAVMQFLRGRVDNAFGIVEKHLAQREFVVGAKPTIADLSLCGYLFYPAEESGIDVATLYPAMTRWLDHLKQLPGWKHPYDLMPGERLTPKW